MKAVIICHAPFEGPGLIKQWLDERAITYQLVKTYENEAVPNTVTADLLVVMGGPMSVNDSLPFLVAERELIKQYVAADKAMFGVCLGAQQLAKAFGAKISPSVKEVGWNPVIANDQKSYQVLHWHGEGFEIPAGATRLFSSKNWPNQGFQLKRAIGLQFHLEAEPKDVENFVANDRKFIAGTIFKQSPEQILATILATKGSFKNRELLFELLDHITE